MEPTVESMFGQFIGRSTLLVGAGLFGAGSGAFQAVDLAIAIDVWQHMTKSQNIVFNFVQYYRRSAAP